MGIKLLILNYVVFPSCFILWKVSSPFLATVLPVHKEVVRDHPGSGIQINPHKQYPVLDFIGLVEQHGYTAEEHKVTTKDGYILGLFRISAGPNNPKTPGKPVVYLQHGFGCTSDIWVTIGPNSDLAFLLVDAGYDVWVGNSRGNIYSRGHVSKDPNSKSYWEFSYHEMGVYDNPAMIDTILNETGVEKLTYIGYEVGSTMSYVLLSTYPEYNNKIDTLYSIGPVAYWNYELEFVSKTIVSLVDIIYAACDYYGWNVLMPNNAMFIDIGRKFCSDHSILTQPICARLYALTGLDHHRMNKTSLPRYFSIYPTSISRRTIEHIVQNIKRKTFQAYDYGSNENLIKYGQAEAPYYSLSKITVPVIIWYCTKDSYINPRDVLDVARDIPNLEALNLVDNKNFDLLDFVWAKDVRKLVYEKIPLLMKK